MRNNICILVYMFANLYFELFYYLKGWRSLGNKVYAVQT